MFSRRLSYASAVGLVVLVAASAGAVPVIALTSTTAASAPSVFHVARTASTNWAGYAVSTSSGAVTYVQGSWVEPHIKGSCPAKNEYSSFWVGIDGFNSGTVEQTGTDSDCQHGVATYYAWYEFYPAGSHVISSIKVHPGDVLSASVTWNSGSSFTTRITDVTTGVSFSKTGSVSGASRSSAEWIAEAPSSTSGVLPLADFGTVSFGGGLTGVGGTNGATISGVSGYIGNFSGVYAIKMVNNAGTATKASTGGLLDSGSSFKCTWKSAGP